MPGKVVGVGAMSMLGWLVVQQSQRSGDVLEDISPGISGVPGIPGGRLARWFGWHPPPPVCGPEHTMSRFKCLVATCEVEPSWQWSCLLPAVTDHRMFTGRCTCKGRMMHHKQTGLWRCEWLAAECAAREPVSASPADSAAAESSSSAAAAAAGAPRAIANHSNQFGGPMPMHLPKEPRKEPPPAASCTPPAPSLPRHV